MQVCRNFIANVLELLQFYTKPSTYGYIELPETMNKWLKHALQTDARDRTGLDHYQCTISGSGELSHIYGRHLLRVISILRNMFKQHYSNASNGNCHVIAKHVAVEFCIPYRIRLKMISLLLNANRNPNPMPLIPISDWMAIPEAIDISNWSHIPYRCKYSCSKLP